MFNFRSYKLVMKALAHLGQYMHCAMKINVLFVNNNSITCHLYGYLQKDIEAWHGSFSRDIKIWKWFAGPVRGDIRL